MSEIEIGRNKRGRRSYSLDDVAVVPSRRTRDPEDVATTWQVDAYHFDIPIFAAPMDSLMSPETAIELGRLGGLGVLDLARDGTIEFVSARTGDRLVVTREMAPGSGSGSPSSKVVANLDPRAADPAVGAEG